MQRPRTLYLPPRAFARFTASFCRPATPRDPIGCRSAIGAFRLATGAFALAAAAFAIIAYQEGGQGTVAIESVRNATIVFRQQEQTHWRTEQAGVSDDQDDDEEAVPSNYPRLVRTVRFVNPDASQNFDAKGERFSKAGSSSYRAEGIASWYGPDFHGRLTANGERYDMHGISAAHRTMPLPSYARVTNLDNGRSIIVRVNNRGPFVHNRLIDLSTGTAKALDFYKKGTAHVRVEFVGRAPIKGSDDQMLLATLRAGRPAPTPSNAMVASAAPFPAKGRDDKELPSSPAEN